MSAVNDSVLSDEELKIFKAIEKNDCVLLKTLLTDQKNVNIVDENSMTPLQHAAYKGNAEIVQMLLDQGANVNLCEHQHKYTALHFAGLSGNVDCCIYLLLAGAKSDVTNSVGRTPSQMAAFVGHHNCVATINNYVPKENVDIFTIATDGKDTELPAFIADSFHKFIMQVNIHPVKVVLNIHNYVGLGEHLPECKKVLELMCEKEMKKGAENNETMAFKFHYLSYVVGEIIKIKQKQTTNKTDDEKKLDITELFTRKILKPGRQGVLEFMEGFIKDCVREFPFRESNLFRQIVASLTGDNPAGALNVLSAAINGQRGFIDNASMCSTCGEEKAPKKCSKCKVVQYCDRNCQRLHWHWHKKACAKLAQNPEYLDKTTPDTNEISSELQNFLINSEK
ncbi:unnamed protein product [Brassicogethes aeneus]|uniref:MYND-type domain-containing protein n=1 Tax=Brassicogethes aeneus TaxID=1431903 RepID=A0A9P0B1N8_BRAAE|nr:unnamed protein product [Brassicogethes aeneus]